MDEFDPEQVAASGSNYLPAATANPADFKADLVLALERAAECVCYDRTCDYCRTRSAP